MELKRIAEELNSLSGEIADARPDLADRIALAADACALAAAEREAARTTELSLLLRLQRELEIDDDDASKWLHAVATDRNLVAWLHQRLPANGLCEGPNIDDALDWAKGNPNQFGRARILATLDPYLATWPLSWRPRTLETLIRHILFGQAASVAFGVANHGRYAPIPGRRFVVYEASFEHGAWTTKFALDRNAMGVFRHWSDWRPEWTDGASVLYCAEPSLAMATMAFRDLTSSGGACGAGWIAGASR